MRRWLLWAPLAGFSLLFALAGLGLFRPADRTIRSALIGRPAPDFVLPPAIPGKPGLSSAELRRGGPRLVNVFASWCVPCIAEAPQLLALRRAGVAIDGVAVRDDAPALRRFIRRNGDPYARVGDDKASAVQLAFGSSGIPESFVVNGRGVVTYQHTGYIQPSDVPVILAEIGKAR